MAVVTDWAVIETSGGPMRMYMARPEGGTAGPGVLIIHEIFGLTDHILDVSRRFAQEGIVALAPELYHALPTRTAPYEDVAGARALRQQLKDDQIVDDLSGALRFLGARGEVRSGLTGVVGYCSGGRDAFMLATRNSDVLALVSYYGSITGDEPSAPINAGGKLEAPALLLYAERDHLISAEQVERVRDTLTRLNKDFDIVTYPNVGHGFFCDARPDSYDADAAADAWNRTVDFLYERLEG
ncbi:MAG: carboxymethylenebutenolidase [Chloroflexota bacterium]|jgi:carboxymethylenebutenolidase|nr:carboxymethylenebutenolidase [Chloroflexota bacterium]